MNIKRKRQRISNVKNAFMGVVDIKVNIMFRIARLLDQYDIIFEECDIANYHISLLDQQRINLVWKTSIVI